MNKMKLPQFLNCVDGYTKNMSHEELEIFVHEIARKLSENKRDEFITLLKSTGDLDKNDNDSVLRNDGRAEIIEQIENIIPILKKINNAEVCLDSEYNEEYDDWYNSDADEILFSDPQELLIDIETAIGLIHKCIDMELNEEGSRLCESVCYLEVFSEGDYHDYDGSPLGIEELFRHGLLDVDFESFKKECLYLTYMGNQLSERAEELYCLFNSFNGCGVSLEDVLQMGSHELPEFDAFLPLWIKYLAKQPGRCASMLLKEAQSMLQDEFALLENARKYVDEHPELYLQILQMNTESDEDEKMLDIGLEAIKAIPQELVIRSDIALLTAYYADKACRFEVREQCWLEALKSNTTVINYMRIKFLPWNAEQYNAQIAEIIHPVFEESQKYRYSSYSEENKRTNYISSNAFCVMMYFEQQFDRMKDIGMSVEENLGWSGTFMKQGLAFLMLLLYRGGSYSIGMKSMISRAMSACGFNKELFYHGTDEKDDKSDMDVFLNIVEKWKDTVHLSENEETAWMNRIEAWIKRRVEGIMDANRRNYYGECAEFIAAFGEVKESFGDVGAKRRFMEAYKNEYSRRRAFHEELRRYGMRK